MIAYASTSYPFLALAQTLGIPYSKVLFVADATPSSRT
jgi:hypothetical protein